MSRARLSYDGCDPVEPEKAVEIDAEDAAKAGAIFREQIPAFSLEIAQELNDALIAGKTSWRGWDILYPKGTS